MYILHLQVPWSTRPPCLPRPVAEEVLLPTVIRSCGNLISFVSEVWTEFLRFRQIVEQVIGK